MPDHMLDFKRITDDRQTASSANGTLYRVIMELAVNVTIDLIMLVVSKGHFAAGTYEACLVPVPGVILAVEIRALGDRLVTSGTDHIISFIHVQRAVWAIITDTIRALKNTVALCTAEMILVPNLAQSIHLGARDDGLTTSCTDRATRLPAVDAEVLSLRVVMSICGEGLVASLTLEMLSVEGMTSRCYKLLSSKDLTTTCMTSVTIWTISRLSRLNNRVHPL